MGESKVQKQDRPREKKSSSKQPTERIVPEVFEVVIECRHEAEQRAVYERMRGEGFRCRVVTL